MFSQDVKGLKVGVPKEVYPEEKRVALTPEGVDRLVKAGFEVLVEDGAGVHASVNNDKYTTAGAKIVPASEALQADIVLKLRMPQDNPTVGTH